jgi:hypothetical protein
LGALAPEQEATPTNMVILEKAVITILEEHILVMYQMGMAPLEPDMELVEVVLKALVLVIFMTFMAAMVVKDY